ncbi:hypothetical protein [Methanobacterium paludis]|uniref:Uncharacterized protein n=1 Tax=Methanobacterium paludis (strain DSM 25820 / JCM 18151 / SWAN1) TaxID=868131 RepID=F6D6V7_METPW|nr:hypothetical protein [Methanobacterium paludis]AEG18995.1 hypothetical protein MSWAN_1986 [Methanobacterium paludis]
MEDGLKYLVLGYRKNTGKTQAELARELEIPLHIVVALEMGSYKYPTKVLQAKIKDLTSQFDQQDLMCLGRGYRIREELGPDFKYFLRGLEETSGISPDELKKMHGEECLRTIGSVDMDEFEVVLVGRSV